VTGHPGRGVPVRLLLVEDSENDAMLLLLFELRLEQTLEGSLVESLENLVDLNRRMARGAYEIELVVREGVPSGLPGGREIVRIVQEALTNVRRHSGARHARVELGVEGEALYAEVRDDGRGFDPGLTRA
jgi:signal transduction histidine kinase